MLFFFVVLIVDVANTVKTYDKFKLMRVHSNDLNLRKDIVHHLSSVVDFWTDPLNLNEEFIDFIVDPGQMGNVSTYLFENSVNAEVVIDDLQMAIRDEQSDQCIIIFEENSFDNQVDCHSIIYGNNRSKRAVFDILMSTLLGQRTRTTENLQNHISIQEDSNGSRNPRKISLNDFSAPFTGPPVMNWRFYHRLDTIHEYMYNLQKNFPKLVQIVEIGRSTEGRPLLVAKVGKEQNYKKPGIFIEGGIHAREWISPATVTFILKNLVENYHANADIMDYYDFYILPVTNPDGYEYSHTNDRMWRKTRSRNSIVGEILDSCVGVDLNRNFDWAWGQASFLQIRAGSKISCTETYAGPEPWSEPESRAVRDAVLELSDRLVMYLAFHSYGQKIVYPWSHTAVPIQDWQDLERMAKIMSSALFEESKGQMRYRYGSAPDVQYIATGGSDDWAKGGAGVKWVFLVELPDRGRHGFLLPSRYIVPTARGAMAALRAAATDIRRTLKPR